MGYILSIQIINLLPTNVSPFLCSLIDIFHDYTISTAFSLLILGFVEKIIRNFAMRWKAVIENMNQEVMRSFSNFKNGTAILQVSWKIILLKQLNLYGYYRQTKNT